MKYPRRSQCKYAKRPYRIRNWPEYEAGLRRRGDLSVWLSDKAINSWRARPSGKPGGQRIYANIAIEAARTIRMALRLPLRQTEGSRVPAAYVKGKTLGLRVGRRDPHSTPSDNFEIGRLKRM